MAKRQRTPAVTPTRPHLSLTRGAAIDAILTAAEKPMPAIVPARRWLCSDGQWRHVFGLPHGVTMTDECRTIGYVFQSVDGTTYGTVRATETEQREFWAAGRARDRADFLEHLNESDDDRIASQASYWLKADVTIVAEAPAEPQDDRPCGDCGAVSPEPHAADCANAGDVTLRCDMDRSCDRPVTHVDAKGYAYCTSHGHARQTSTRCRQLTPAELTRLQAGNTLPRY